jgi:hypothetical protein
MIDPTTSRAWTHGGVGLYTGGWACGRELSHRGVLGRLDIPDIGPPSILALLGSRPPRPHAAVESII